MRYAALPLLMLVRLCPPLMRQSNQDDPTIPTNTLRVWVLGILGSITLAGVNQVGDLLLFHRPSPSRTPDCQAHLHVPAVLLLSLPIRDYCEPHHPAHLIPSRPPHGARPPARRLYQPGPVQQCVWLFYFFIAVDNLAEWPWWPLY
jgi:hypothetical protein